MISEGSCDTEAENSALQIHNDKLQLFNILIIKNPPFVRIIAFFEKNLTDPKLVNGLICKMIH